MQSKTTFPVEILTTAEANALLAACSSRAPTGIRNRALLAVLYRSGLRVGEALALRPADVDLEAGTIRVLRGKGGKARTVGIDAQACSVVARWLDRRRTSGTPRTAPLFCTLAGEPLSDRYVRAMVKRMAERAGIQKRVHPHALRHTHASELAAEGVPMNLLQAQLGHSSLATTDRYVRHIAPAQLVQAIRAREWVVD
jgi:site-specific recombinase XerD